MGTLTVRENLMFSASLRLSSRVSFVEKTRRVEETLLELGLTECADNKVSERERKRERQRETERDRDV